MIQVQTELLVADNTGAKKIECKPYSKTKRFEVLGENKWYKFKQNY